MGRHEEVWISTAIRSHWLVKDPTALGLWLSLLAEAEREHKSTMFNGRVIALEPGELPISVRALAEEAGWTHKKARLFLSRLERHGLIKLRIEGRVTIVRMTGELHSFADPYQTAGGASQ